jgi:SAM-dependent methyltransferase
VTLDAWTFGSHVARMNDTPAPRSFYEADSLSTEVYDALAAGIIPGSPMDGDVDFYRRLAGKTGGPILDVGCGTGRVAAALATDGHEVVAVDLSAPMLRLAEQRRASLEAEVAARLSFRQADMTTLDLGRDFALIVTPSRVFQFALTSDAQREALTALRRHLRPDGRLVSICSTRSSTASCRATNHRPGAASSFTRRAATVSPGRSRPETPNQLASSSSRTGCIERSSPRAGSSGPTPSA